jgi:conjugative transfer signal peptidase TraF
MRDLAPGRSPRRAAGDDRRSLPGRPRQSVVLALAIAACAAAAAAAWWPPLRINLSPSLPLGLYRLTAATRAAPGDLVLACPPPRFAALALARHYLLPGSCPGGTMAVGKLLLAVAGDRVQVAANGMAVNGHALPGTAAAATDAAGRPLPPWPAASRPVGRAEIWLVAPHPRSLDSRYFGPVARSLLRGRLLPLATLGGGGPAAALAAAIRRAHPARCPSCAPGCRRQPPAPTSKEPP